MKKILITTFVAALCLNSYAQSDVDALRYSQSFVFGNAKSAGSAGAFGAIGGDLSSAIINPAGLAVYRSNYFVIGGDMTNTKANINYLESTRKDFNYSFGIPSLGFVFHNKKYSNRQPAKKGWISTNFAITSNRTNSFNGIRNYTGQNNQNTMLDYFAESASGLNVNQLSATEDELAGGYYTLETMFWDAYLIDSIGPLTYGATLDPFNRSVQQKNIITSSGSSNDIALHLASNYENKFYLGGGLKLTSLRYRETNRFQEDNLTNTGGWTMWNLERSLYTRGYGLSANLGVIVRPSNHVRFGASLNTPTVLNLKDEYVDNLYVEYDNGDYGNYETSKGFYDYKTVTPLKTTLSGAYLFGKKGFVSADLDILDYSTMRLQPVDVFESVNENITGKYSNTTNLRIGGEYVLNMVRLRGGYARYGSPLSNPENGNLTNQFITTGIGIKDNNWALDMSVVHQMRTELIQPYTLEGSTVPVATNSLRRNILTVSLTTKF